MKIKSLISLYAEYRSVMDKVIDIRDETSYMEAKIILDELFELAGDQEGDPYGEVIVEIGNAINNYELKSDQSLRDFIDESNRKD